MVAHSRHVLHHLRELIAHDPDRFSANVYTRLFGLSPDLRDLFGPTMSDQRQAFYHVIDHVLEAIPAPDGQGELIEFLAQLARDHRKYGVLPGHYPLMYRALMGEFASLMGPYWDDEAARTVSQAMMLTTGVMRGAAQTAQTPARWQAKVVEKFRISRNLAVVRLVASMPLTFEPGQYLETQIPQWPHTWRNLSPAIPPSSTGELEFHVRAIRGGAFSTSIVNETRAGDVWQFGQAHGTLAVHGDAEVLMVAGGTGLAPLRALLIDMSKRVDNPRTHIFYGMRHPGELYDLAVLRRIASTNPWLRVTAVSELTTDPWWLDAYATPEALGIEHRIGALDDIVADYDEDFSERQVLLAGPAGMITTLRHRLIIAGVRSSQISYDPVD